MGSRGGADEFPGVIWLPRSSVGARPDAPASPVMNSPSDCWSDQPASSGSHAPAWEPVKPENGRADQRRTGGEIKRRVARVAGGGGKITGRRTTTGGLPGSADRRGRRTAQAAHPRGGRHRPGTAGLVKVNATTERVGFRQPDQPNAGLKRPSPAPAHNHPPPAIRPAWPQRRC